ncbi:MAG: DUF86 domain-containing protein [Thermodesulforhabdaceae bacterium]
MRDRLIHGYFGIDYKLVWDAIKIDIPKLRPELQKVLKELEGLKERKTFHTNSYSIFRLFEKNGVKTVGEIMKY